MNTRFYGFVYSHPAAPAKTDKSLEIASIPTSIHFALSLKFIVSHCFTHKNLPPAIFYFAVFILQALIPVRVQCFSKSLFFTSTRTLNSKNPLFSILLSWDVNFSSQRKADVFRLKFDVKMGNFLCPIT